MDPDIAAVTCASSRTLEDSSSAAGSAGLQEGQFPRAESEPGPCLLDFHQPGAPASLCSLSTFILRSLRSTAGHLTTDHTDHSDYSAREQQLLITLINCRYEVVSLRRYCSAVGYGWDYPDSTFRDIPLFYPQFLCSRLISMVTCSPRFRLRPYGLLGVCQTVRLLKPLDELKRGTFSLREEEGWSSTITLISPHTAHTRGLQRHAADDSTFERCIRVAVPWWASVMCGGPGFSLPLPSSLLGYGCPATLWAVSRCLAETEKLKGADAVRAPLTLTAHYRRPLRLPRAVSIRIRESSTSSHSSADRSYTFTMEDDTAQTLILTGEMQAL
ncbi:hypothetical protein AOLI_G00274260 [Acnodon oligacanthus]